MPVQVRSLVFVLLVACDPAAVETPVAPDAPPEPPPEHVLDAQTGDPGLGSIDALSFGPDGHLVIGDGARDRLIVLLTGDVTWDEGAAEFGSISNVDRKVGDLLGVDAGDVTITAVTVNPASGRVYVGASRTDTDWAGLFTVQSDGALAWLDLEPLRWVRVSYPETGGDGSLVADVEWVGDESGTIVAAVSESTWTQSQLVTVPVPVEHAGDTAVTTTRTYHRTHRQWETMAPITSLFSFVDDTGSWVGATYTCSPVVRFDVDALAAGEAETVGVTPFDYGGGRSVVDFAVIGEDDDRDILALVSGLGGARVGPSLFLAEGEVDEAAPVIFGWDALPAHDEAALAPKLDDALRISPLDALRLVVWDGSSLDTVDRPR